MIPAHFNSMGLSSAMSDSDKSIYSITPHHHAHIKQTLCGSSVLL